MPRQHNGNILRWLLFCPLLVWLSIQASAHNGPPFRVLDNQKMGPYVVSVWTHADLGASPFWVMVSATQGGHVSDDLKVEIVVRPLNDKGLGQHYSLARETQEARLQYKGDVTLGLEGSWQIRVLLQSSQGSSEAITIVQATPHGFGHWDLLLFALPFLLIGWLWLASHRRKPFRNREPSRVGM